MKYILSAEQKNFFNRNGFIEFEDFLSDKQQASLLDTPPNIGERGGVRSEAQRKIIYSQAWAKIAAELTSHRGLRFAYDEVCTASMGSEEQPSLQEGSSIRPLVCAVMIGLQGDSGRAANSVEEGCFTPFPVKARNARFFLPTLRWGCVSQSTQTCLLVAYADLRAMYLLEPRDPHTHLLKRLGYVFGDRLRGEHHPVLVHAS